MQNNLQSYNEELFNHYARLGKAISSSMRLAILDVLAQGPRSVELLASHTGGSVANISRHLQILREAKFVLGKRHGRTITYHLADNSVATFLEHLRQFGETHVLEIERTKQDFIESRIGFDAVSKDELLRRVSEGEAVAIDVRPVEEYEANHLTGAISVPLEQLEQMLEEIPKDRDVVAYCRGPHCVLSVEAVNYLRKHGYRAHRIDMGPHEFHELGFELMSTTGNAG